MQGISASCGVLQPLPSLHGHGICWGKEAVWGEGSVHPALAHSHEVDPPLQGVSSLHSTWMRAVGLQRVCGSSILPRTTRPSMGIQTALDCSKGSQHPQHPQPQGSLLPLVAMAMRLKGLALLPPCSAPSIHPFTWARPWPDQRWNININQS